MNTSSNMALNNSSTDYHSPVDDEADEPTYNEAFPPLAAGDGGGQPGCAWQKVGAWGHKRTQVKHTTVTQVFNVPLEERRLQEQRFGDQAEQVKVCQDIQTKVGGVSVETSLSKDQSLTVVVTGKPEQVRKAKNLLTNKLQIQVVCSLPIPHEHHGAILGKNGWKILELQEKTGTKISIPRQNEDSENITIVGTKEGVDRAKHDIQMESDKLANMAIEHLHIPKCFHPFICGPNNKVKQDIQARTGARVNIVPPGVQLDRISVNGEKDAVALAVKAIMEIYEEKKRTCRTCTLQVKKSQHKYILRNAGINEFLAEYDVSVEVPPLDALDDETITLMGESSKLSSAVNAVFTKSNSAISVSIEAPSWLHRLIIGKRGANIKKITQDLPKVDIEFRDNKITLEGPPEEVEEVKQVLEEFTHDLIDRMCFTEIEVDQQYHRFVIGKNGANINRIKAEYGVSIRVPSENEHSAIIRIEGEKNEVENVKEELIEMVRKMENEISKSVLIENRFHSTIIGSKGEQIKEIRDRFNQVQIAFPEEGKKSDIVHVRGPREDVEKCASYLSLMYKDILESSYRLEVKVEKQYHKNVIGKGGSTIKKIRDDTETKIDLPGENDISTSIIITGKKANAEEAKRRIQIIGEEQAKIKEIIVEIPHKLHNALIGAKGRLVRAIQDDFPGVQIGFPPLASQSDQVTIRGPSDSVENAKKQLLDLSKEREENSFKDEVYAKPEYHKFLIGRGGLNIRKIRDETGARIVFPSFNDEDQKTIIIMGKKECVAKAKQELQGLIKTLEDSVEETIVIEQRFHGHFVARRFELLRQLGDDYDGVLVSFPRKGDRSEKVTIKGPKDYVRAAKERIEGIVHDLASQVTIECVIPQMYHRQVMGSRGHNVEEISFSNQVKVKFPDRPIQMNGEMSPNDDHVVNGDGLPDEGVEVEAVEMKPSKYDIILITGKPANCEAASQAFQELVPVTDSVVVPFRFHRFIIGQNGRDVRQMMDQYDVNISIPAADERLDRVTVSGAPANLRKAIQALEEKSVQLQAEEDDRELKNFALSFDVKTEYHPKIIGRKGAVITKIREEHNVQVQFQERGAEDGAQITVIGYEANAKAARDDIMKIVNELEDMVSEVISMDPRYHARVIGQRGRQVRTIMDKFNVDIRFPASNAPEPDRVTVTGSPDNVDDCLDHLQLLADEYEQDLHDRQVMQQYQKPQSQRPDDKQYAAPGDALGYKVRNAPWDMSSTEDFPTIGAAASAPAAAVPTSMSSSGTRVAFRQNVVWGPSRR